VPRRSARKRFGLRLGPPHVQDLVAGAAVGIVGDQHGPFAAGGLSEDLAQLLEAGVARLCASLTRCHDHAAWDSDRTRSCDAMVLGDITLLAESDLIFRDGFEP
jgi:hypothetical protein